MNSGHQRMRTILNAAILGLASISAHADPIPIDYCCGGDISIANGAPADGWTHADSSRVPGRTGNSCWIRIDVSSLAPRVLQISGADGSKDAALFDGSGKPLATARDVGERSQAIVGSGGDVSRMLFPALQTASTPIYARVERSRYAVVISTVDLTPSIQSEREMCMAAGMNDYLSKPIRVAQPIEALLRTQPREDIRIA